MSCTENANRVANALVGMAERIRSGQVQHTNVEAAIVLDDPCCRHDYFNSAIVRVTVPREAIVGCCNGRGCARCCYR